MQFFKRLGPNSSSSDFRKSLFEAVEAQEVAEAAVAKLEAKLGDVVVFEDDANLAKLKRDIAGAREKAKDLKEGIAVLQGSLDAAEEREADEVRDRQVEEAEAARAEGIALIKDYVVPATKIVTIFRRLTEIHRIIADANSAIALAGRGMSVSIPEEDVANATGQYGALYVDCVLADPSNSLDVIWPPRPAALKVVDKKVGAA